MPLDSPTKSTTEASRPYDNASAKPSAGPVPAAHVEFVAALSGQPPRPIPINADPIDLEDRADHLDRMFGTLSVYVTVILDDTAHNIPGGLDRTKVPSSASGATRGYLRLRDFRKRTPSPPPFSSMSSMPAASMARCSFARASSETRGPNPPSSRLTVGRDSPARSASSD